MRQTQRHTLRKLSLPFGVALFVVALQPACGSSDSSETNTGGSGGMGGADPKGGSDGGGGDATGGMSGPGGSSGAMGGAGAAHNGDAELNEGNYDVGDFNAASLEMQAGHHPMARRETFLLPRDELAVIMPGDPASGFALDDPQDGFAEMDEDPADDLGDWELSDVTTANLDDDGHAEWLGVGLNDSDALEVRMVDSAGSGVFSTTRTFIVAGDDYKHAWIETADLDQDGRDEIGIVGLGDAQVVVRVYDDATEDFELMVDVYSGPDEEIALAFANIDEDRDVEMGLLIDRGEELQLEVRDGLAQDFSVIQTLDEQELGLYQGGGVRGLRLEAGRFGVVDPEAPGDPNADSALTRENLREKFAVIADGYYEENSPNEGAGGVVGILVANTASEGEGPQFSSLSESLQRFEQPHPMADYRTGNEWGWHTLAADSNGDGSDEMYVMVRDSTGNNPMWKVFHRSYGEERDSWSPGGWPLEVAELQSSFAPGHLAAMAGQEDSFGQEVIVSVLNDGDLLTQRVVLVEHEEEVDDQGEAVVRASLQPLDDREALNADGVWLATGDFQADGLRIRFTGEKWFELSRPRPIVFLAAAPAKADITQNYPAMSTGYAISAGSEVLNSQQYAVTHNATVSFAQGLPGASFLSAGVNAAFSESFAHTNTQSKSTTYTSSYSGGYPDDVLVFQGVLFTRYEYEVVGGDPALVGELMTIDVPQEARTYKWTVGLYNDSLKDQASTIGEKILTHEPGDPSSYPSPQDRDMLSPTWETPDNQVMTVGQGNGSSGIEIEISRQNSSGGARTVTTEFGGSLSCFVDVGYSQAWDETSAYSVTASEATVFAGDVGDIEDENEYEQYRYSFGLFVYPTTLDGGERFHVVQYWTEDFGDGY